jgi:choline-sulfatase
LFDILERTRMADNTIIVFTSDHGDMLGERGAWFKMSFLEGACRVPLMIAAPGMAAGLNDVPVSTLDVLPTLLHLSGLAPDAASPWCDGESLVPVAAGGRRSPVPMEYAAEGTITPMVAIRDGDLKYIHCPADPPMLFDLAADPLELENRAGRAISAEAEARLKKQIDSRWNLAAYDAAVRESQARRLVVYEALRNGSYYPWDYQPLQKASERYMRNHMDLNVLEDNQRFPRGE